MNSYRISVIQNLLQLKAAYKWEQFSSRPVSVDFDEFCKPCSPMINAKACSCCSTDCMHLTEDFGDINQAFEEVDDSPLVIKSTSMMGRSAHKRVIYDSDDNADIVVPPAHSENHSPNSYSTENSPVLRVPASTRSKTSRRIISDSESETEPLSVSKDPVQSKLFLPSQKSSQDSCDRMVTSRLDEISLGDSSAAESDDSPGENRDDDDSWIVDDGSDAEEQDNSDRDAAENVSGFSDADQENVRPARRNVVIDLSQSPDSPPATTKKPVTKKARGILNANTSNATPARGKGKTAQFALGTVETPQRKLSRTEVNQQRVEALSTGKKKFKGASAELAVQLYQVYNEVIFDNQLPLDMSVTWNKRLLTTAGYCKCHKKYIDGEMQRTASIELSTKVVDSDERLRSTLIHEMCHAANWLIDLLDQPKHGSAFQQWGRRATKQFPDIAVTTCHSYRVHMPHKFQCTRTDCGVQYSRHSKKGLNPDKQRCGVCRSRIEYIGIANKEGVVAKPRQASGFSAYVKEHFARTKLSLPVGISTADVMKVLAAQYKAEKAERADEVQQAATGAGLDSAFPGAEAVNLYSDGGDDLYSDGEGERQDDTLDQIDQLLVDLTI